MSRHLFTPFFGTTPRGLTWTPSSDAGGNGPRILPLRTPRRGNRVRCEDGHWPIGCYVGPIHRYVLHSRNRLENRDGCHRPRILRTDGRGGQRGQQPSPATGVERCGKLARVGSLWL